MLTAVIHTDLNGLLTTNGVQAYKSREYKKYLKELTAGSMYGSGTKIILTNTAHAIELRKGLTNRNIFIPDNSTFNNLPVANKLSNFLNNELYALFCTAEYYNKLLLSCNKIIICYTNQEVKGPGETPGHLNLALLNEHFGAVHKEELQFCTRVTYLPVVTPGQQKFFIGKDMLKTVYTNSSCIPGFELDAEDNTIYYPSKELFESEAEAIEYLRSKLTAQKVALDIKSAILQSKLDNLNKYNVSRQ